MTWWGIVGGLYGLSALLLIGLFRKAPLVDEFAYFEDDAPTLPDGSSPQPPP